jgi:hypothetical protein
MPCRVSSDVHEWINEGPTVPTRSPVNPRNVGEQSTIPQRGKKTLWRFTAACCWDAVEGTERRREPSIPASPGAGGGADVTPPAFDCIPYRGLVPWDNGRWAVRLGRHPLEKISRGPKGRLRRDRNPPLSVRAKAGLTGPLNARGPEAKAGPSDPSTPTDGGWR